MSDATDTVRDLAATLAETAGSVSIREIECRCKPGEWPCECGDRLFNRDKPRLRISVGGRVVVEEP